jgi:hypothetical protein
MSGMRATATGGADPRDIADFKVRQARGLLDGARILSREIPIDVAAFHSGLARQDARGRACQG